MKYGRSNKTCPMDFSKKRKSWYQSGKERKKKKEIIKEQVNEFTSSESKSESDSSVQHFEKMH
jgi:hypothetical protein